MTSPETGNAHDAEDCGVDCEHPDHAFDDDNVDFYDLLMAQLAQVESWWLNEGDGPVLL